MILEQLEVENFRSLKEITVPMHELTILIGENDAGKSSILDLLGMAFGEANPDEDDYYKCPDLDGGNTTFKVADEIQVTLVFRPDEWDSDLLGDFVALDGMFHFRRTFRRNAPSETQCLGKKYVVETLNQDISKLQVPQLNEIIDELGLPSDSGMRKAERAALIEDHKSTARTTESWIDVDLRRLRDVLPRFQRYRALDYASPETFVRKTLQAVYESTIFEEDAEGKKPIQSLRDLRDVVETEVNRKVGELCGYIRTYNPRVKQITLSPTVDFGKGFSTGEFYIDDGRGPHPLSKTGDGTKRRVLMATLDWDRKIVEESLRDQTIIRAYDEPDTNLHYDAQHQLFEAISKSVGIQGEQTARIQSVICTHSLTMIDRAPAKSINSLSIKDDGCTAIGYLKTDEDGEIEDFLHLLARELGITNTMLFYERCYLLFEGETEESTLPILYRRLYNSSMIDDGIRLINLEGNGGWLGLLRLLGKNREELTLGLFDMDCKQEMWERFEKAGYNQTRWEEQTLWIGEKEFEDAFPNEVLHDCITQGWPRVDGQPWEIQDIQDLRLQALDSSRKKDKFSTALEKMVSGAAQPGNRCRKPELGRLIGQRCPTETIPTEILQLFEKARSIAGVL